MQHDLYYRVILLLLPKYKGLIFSVLYFPQLLEYYLTNNRCSIAIFSTQDLGIMILITVILSTVENQKEREAYLLLGVLCSYYVIIPAASPWGKGLVSVQNIIKHSSFLKLSPLDTNPPDTALGVPNHPCAILGAKVLV